LRPRCNNLIQPRIQPGYQRREEGAKQGLVFITDRGRPAHVLLTIEDYQRLTGAVANIVDLLAMPKLRGDARGCMSPIRGPNGTR
jgi:hypothetical protein